MTLCVNKIYSYVSGGAMLDEALHSAQGGRRYEATDSADYLQGLGRAALDPDRQEASKAVGHLPTRHLVARMALQTRIEYGFEPGMPL